MQSSPDGVAVIRSGKPTEFIKMNLDSDPLYGVYVRSFCRAVRKNEVFSSDLNRMTATMKIIDAGYKSAARGLAVPV